MLVIEQQIFAYLFILGNGLAYLPSLMDAISSWSLSTIFAISSPMYLNVSTAAMSPERIEKVSIMSTRRTIESWFISTMEYDHKRNQGIVCVSVKAIRNHLSMQDWIWVHWNVLICLYFSLSTIQNEASAYTYLGNRWYSHSYYYRVYNRNV